MEITSKILACCFPGVIHISDFSLYIVNHIIYTAPTQTMSFSDEMFIDSMGQSNSCFNLQIIYETNGNMTSTKAKNSILSLT